MDLLRDPCLGHARWMSRRTDLSYLVAAAVASAALAMARPPRPQAVTDANKVFMDAYRSADPIVDWPLKKMLHEIPELKGLQPAADQSALPATLTQAAERLQTFWQDFQNTSSLETIEESRQRHTMPASDIEQATRQFRYLMMTDPANPVQIEEYRTDSQGRDRNSEPAAWGFLRTSGFASLPLVFGAGAQPLCGFRNLGSQILRQRLYKVVAFAQHVDPAALSHWHIQDQDIPILIQGVAWIDPANGQVVQLRSDLLAPQPRVALRRATTLVTLAPVEFHNSRGVFWLPEDVTVTIDLDTFTFVNRHHYSDYQKFTVSTDEKTTQSGAPQH